MSEPQVSIVISTFNRAHRLPEALRALARQSVAVPHEVIVVDNHSTDGTSAIVESCRAWFGVPLHYVLEPRRGVSYARNAGVHWARGALLAFVDDDVQVDGAWLERLVAVAAAHPEIDCFGGKVLPRWRQMPPTWLDRRHWSPVALTDHGDEPFTVSAARPQCLISANLIVRRRAFDRAGLFSPDFRRSQDHEWLVRFWRAGLVGLYHPAIVVWVDVDAERLARRYHRRWHVQHGRYAARMRLREVIDQEGRLRSLPACARVFGTPRFVFRELMREGLAAVGLTLTGADASRRFERFDAVCDLLGYICESAVMWAAGREQGRGDRRIIRVMPLGKLAQPAGRVGSKLLGLIHYNRSSVPPQRSATIRSISSAASTAVAAAGVAGGTCIAVAASAADVDQRHGPKLCRAGGPILTTGYVPRV